MMATSQSPDPDEFPDDDLPDRWPGSAPLSQWERKVLNSIEDDLTRDDPRFAERMYAREFAPARLAISPRRAVAVTVGLVVLVIFPALMTTTGWAVFVLIATVLVLPLLLFWAVERHSGGGSARG